MDAYFVKNGESQRKRLKYVLPEQLLSRVIKMVHEQQNVNLTAYSPHVHLRMNATLMAVRQHFWRPNIQKLVETYVKNCECTKIMASGTRNQGTLGTTMAVSNRDIMWIDIYRVSDLEERMVVKRRNTNMH